MCSPPPLIDIIVDAMGTSTSRLHRHHALVFEETNSGRMMVLHWHGSHYETFVLHTLPEDYWLLAYTSYDWVKLDQVCRAHHTGCRPWRLATLERLGVPTAASDANQDTVVYNRLWCVGMKSVSATYIKEQVTYVY